MFKDHHYPIATLCNDCDRSTVGTVCGEKHTTKIQITVLIDQLHYHETVQWLNVQWI